MNWRLPWIARIRKVYAAARRLKWYCDDLNRRSRVEAHLFDCAAGKRPLPTPDDCRRLALDLGVPEEYRLPPKSDTEQ